MQMSILRHTMHCWNSLYYVCSNSRDWRV